MEYCPLGNLEKYLRTNKHIFIMVAPGNKADLAHYDPEKFTTKNLYQYSHQIAKGMMFLEQKRVVYNIKLVCIFLRRTYSAVLFKNMCLLVRLYTVTLPREMFYL